LSRWIARALDQYERAQEEMEISVEDGAIGAIDYFHRSRIYAARGETQKALNDLERAFARGFRDFAGIDACPEFESLRSDPRFKKLIAQRAPEAP